jgi:hypothetical protein
MKNRDSMTQWQTRICNLAPGGLSSGISAQTSQGAGTSSVGASVSFSKVGLRALLRCLPATLEGMFLQAFYSLWASPLPLHSYSYGWSILNLEPLPTQGKLLRSRGGGLDVGWEGRGGLKQKLKGLLLMPSPKSLPWIGTHPALSSNSC